MTDIKRKLESAGRLRDSSVSEMFALQAEGPEFDDSWDANKEA